MELKPCPFCGELPVGDDGQVATRHTDGSKWGAVSCCCSGPEVRTGYEAVENWMDDAIAEWNTRPIEDAQSAEIARLTADVEFWKSAAEAQRRKNCDEEDNGTGKVWPSVEGEIVREEWARPYPDDQWSINVAGVGWLQVSGPGQWRIIVQKVGEKP